MCIRTTCSTATVVVFSLRCCVPVCSETIARVTGGMKVKADRDEVRHCPVCSLSCSCVVLLHGNSTDVVLSVLWLMC